MTSNKSFSPVFLYALLVISGMSLIYALTSSKSNLVATVSPRTQLAQVGDVTSTIGKTSVGGATSGVNLNYLYCTKGTRATAGTVTSITADIYGNGTNWKAVLVQADKTIVTNGTSNSNTSTGAYTWITFTFSTPPTITAQTYYICV